MMKRKILIPVLAVMLCVGMIGVGFAAWVITSTTSHEVNNGTQIKAYDVQSYVVDHVSTFTEGAIAFGTDGATKDAEGNDLHTWLKMDNAENSKEDLLATLQVTLDTEDLTAMAGRSFVLNVSSPLIDGNSTTTAAYAPQYIKLPEAVALTIKVSSTGTVETVTYDGVVYTPDQGATSDEIEIDVNKDGVKDIKYTTAGVFTLQLIFGWGTEFNGTNPNTFYNSHDATAIVSGTTTYSAHAAAALGKVWELNEKTYLVTVSTDILAN